MSSTPVQIIKTPYQQTSSLNSIINGGDPISAGYALAKTLSFFGRIIGFFVLITLLVVASVVWIWITSFRRGWEFWTWVDQNLKPADSESQTKLALNLVVELIIIFISPVALFADWSQKQLQKWLGISFPSEVDIRSIIEKQLGIKNLDNKLPSLTKAKENSLNS
jgi:hypothetical protein